MSKHSGAKCTNDIISFCARVSNPSNQKNFTTAAKLLTYCMKKSHWSIFEMVDVCFEIFTTRDIGRQILRHKTASFQEFSQRYAEVDSTKMFIRECRKQDPKNRQSSIEVDPTDPDAIWWATVQEQHIDNAIAIYKEALERGIAKEQARCVLPEGNTPSIMYMKGSLRTWIHYCLLRMGNGTQKEHREIACMIWKELQQYFRWLKDIEIGTA
jgi:thymidylate synthase (FAD)